MVGINLGKIKFWIAFVLSLILFFAPLPQGEGRFHLDKIVHAIIFILLTYLGLRAYATTKTPLITGLLFYAFLVEYLQFKIFIWRSFDFSDIAGDSLGIVIGLAAWFFLERKFKARVL